LIAFCGHKVTHTFLYVKTFYPISCIFAKNVIKKCLGTYVCMDISMYGSSPLPIYRLYINVIFVNLMQGLPIV
ncbi:MAG: hypothetical protein IKV32_02115, partial [Muribaculaceae bacterium]|nr:hypothetical protein [Muribaculaceae bacterium]